MSQRHVHWFHGFLQCVLEGQFQDVVEEPNDATPWVILGSLINLKFPPLFLDTKDESPINGTFSICIFLGDSHLSLVLDFKDCSNTGGDSSMPRKCFIE